ncbi:hypothetical protein ABB34_05150 [Stenotrophomonas daejeonensis]|uniref:Uncharacterized protein n=1 Tax=Stenotrophomonas daejeonensis TaxID=659018 RepID=A0A0R0DYJ6_9GAMM|nr:hypothetical protein ABB34_05150 [Stenotrophomonas daejeonensis]
MFKFILFLPHFEVMCGLVLHVATIEIAVEIVVQYLGKTGIVALELALHLDYLHPPGRGIADTATVRTIPVDFCFRPVWAAPHIVPDLAKEAEAGIT